MTSLGEILLFIKLVITKDKSSLYSKDRRNFFVILRLVLLLFVSHYTAV